MYVYVYVKGGGYGGKALLSQNQTNSSKLSPEQSGGVTDEN